MKMKTTWWEIAMAAKETVTAGDEFVSKRKLWLHDINVDGGVFGICCEALTKDAGCTPINIEFMLNGDVKELIQITSYEHEPNILRFARHEKADENGELKEASTLAVYMSDENNLPDEWQEAIREWVNYELDKACEVIWRRDVIDVPLKIYIEYGTVFIIPNAACTAYQLLPSIRERVIPEMTELCRINQVPYDPEKTKLVQVWMGSIRGDWYYDNLQDHSPMVQDKDGNRYQIHFPTWLPETMIKDWKEGHRYNIEIPSRVTKYVDHHIDDVYNAAKVETRIVMENLVPVQTLMRYRGFGAFQVVLEDLCK